MTPSFWHDKFLQGGGWFATGWSVCLILWTLALGGRLLWGPVLWVRVLWQSGLTGAALILVLLAGLSIGHAIAGLRIRH